MKRLVIPLALLWMGCGSGRAKEAPVPVVGSSVAPQIASEGDIFQDKPLFALYSIGDFGVFRIDEGKTARMAVPSPPLPDQRQIFIVWPPIDDRYDPAPVLKGQGITVLPKSRNSIYIYKPPKKFGDKEVLDFTAGMKGNHYRVELSVRLCDVYDETDPVCNKTPPNTKPRLFILGNSGTSEIKLGKIKKLPLLKNEAEWERHYFVVWPPVNDIYDNGITGEVLEVSEEPSVFFFKAPKDRKGVHSAAIAAHNESWKIQFEVGY